MRQSHGRNACLPAVAGEPAIFGKSAQSDLLARLETARTAY